MKCMEKNITVNIQRGVHGRIATRLTRIAQEHDVLLHILHDAEEIDCSSVLDVLSMAFVSGTSLRFRIQGKDVEPALAAIEKLFSSKEE